MTQKAVVIDRRPAWLEDQDPSASVLTLPVGRDTVLGALAARLVEAAGHEAIVYPAFDPPAGYVERLRRLAPIPIQMVTHDALMDALRACESSDTLLLVEAAHWPEQGHGFADAVERHAGYRGATHLVAVGSNLEGTREAVEFDPQGRVARVHRLYNCMTWPEAVDESICCTIVPARAVLDTRFASLAELRSALVARRILSQDVPLASDVDDITLEQGLLSLNHRLLGSGAADVTVGCGVSIAPTARLVGPIALHDRVVIGEQATVVGPAVLAAGARVEPRAVVAHSILLEGSSVRAGTTVRQRIIAPAREGSAPLSPAEASVPTVPGRSPSVLPGQAVVAARAERPGPRRRTVQLAIKRAFDVAVAAVLLLLQLPLVALIAVLIRLDSPGPVFFRHRREGRGGREFDCLKFRTMVSNAHEMQRKLYAANELDGPQFKMRDDPRITRVGRWLRATNLDELPQLINVLRGDMSLVGPRPSPFRENQICVPWRRARLSVRPGITGLWQVCRSPDRSAGDFHEWIYYDMAYVRSFSLWLDLKIMLATVVTLGGRHGIDPAWLIPAHGHAGAASPHAAPAA